MSQQVRGFGLTIISRKASTIPTSPGYRLAESDPKPIPSGLFDEFYLVGYGSMTMPETGNYNFSLCSVGKSRLFVDDTLVVDNGYDKAQTLGDTFYGKMDTPSSPSYCIGVSR